MGTPYYVAPEILNRNYDEKSDIWSLGVIYMFMMINIRPFDAPNIDVLF